MDVLFVPISEALGASIDQIKLISCLLIAYPLGSIFIRIPPSQPALKHVFNIAVTLFFFVTLNLYWGTLQLLADVLATYFLAKYVKSANMPWIVFGVVMGHLTVNHVIRAIFEVSYSTFEVTAPQMVLIMKLSTFGWNVWDGRRPTEDLDKWQQLKAVRKFPSLLEFLGYSFYFPGVLVGPYLAYAEYQALIDESLFKVTGVVSKTKKGLSVPTGRKRVAYRKMGTGLIFLGIYVFYGGSYNYTTSLAPWFAQMTLLRRIAWIQLFGIIERCKYYAIWILTEGASILTGLGFSGFGPAGETLWDGAANVKPLQIELPENFKVLLDSWNMNTNVWLRECVYKRVTPKGKKPGNRSSMLTFATSAFWHGIYPGYYLVFLFGGFVTSAARLARKNIRPLVLPPPGTATTLLKQIYDIAGTVLSIVVLNYTASPFMLLTLHDSLACWRLLGWYGHYIVFGSLVFFYAGGQTMFRGIHPAAHKEGGKGQKTPNSSGSTTPVESFAIPPSLDSFVHPLEKKL